MSSVDSDIGYDMGSMHSDISLLEDPPSLSEVVSANSSAPAVTPAPFLSARPANPAMAALTSQHREAHNRSPISFREGRRASDTSLTQGQKPPFVSVLLLRNSRHITASSSTNPSSPLEVRRFLALMWRSFFKAVKWIT